MRIYVRTLYLYIVFCTHRYVPKCTYSALNIYFVRTDVSLFVLTLDCTHNYKYKYVHIWAHIPFLEGFSDSYFCHFCLYILYGFLKMLPTPFLHSDILWLILIVDNLVDNLVDNYVDIVWINMLISIGGKIITPPP